MTSRKNSSRWAWGGMIPLLLAGLTAQAAPPVWWSSGTSPVIDPAAAPNNAGPATIGQAKWMTKNALIALSAQLPDVALQIENDLFATGGPLTTWDAPAAGTAAAEAQKAPLQVGQLKALAAPFYARLGAAAPHWLTAEKTTNGTNITGTLYPWTVATTDDANGAIATVGQLKAMFSLRFERDSDNGGSGDGMTDLWEDSFAQGLLATSGTWTSTQLAQLNSGDLDPAQNYSGEELTTLVYFQRTRNPSPQQPGEALSKTPKDAPPPPLAILAQVHGYAYYTINQPNAVEKTRWRADNDLQQPIPPTANGDDRTSTSYLPLTAASALAKLDIPNSVSADEIPWAQFTGPRRFPYAMGNFSVSRPASDPYNWQSLRLFEVRFKLLRNAASLAGAYGRTLTVFTQDQSSTPITAPVTSESLGLVVPDKKSESDWVVMRPKVVLGQVWAKWVEIELP